MAITPLNDPSYLGLFLDSNGRPRQTWLNWFNQLKASGDTSSANAAAIALLQTGLATTNGNLAALTIRVTAVEANQAVDEAAIAALQTGLAANVLQTGKNTVELVNHEFRIQQLETYRSVFATRIVSANYQVVYADYGIDVDASGGAVTITLPAAVKLVLGEVHVISKFDATLNTVTIDGNGKLIDGAATAVLLLPGWSVDLQWNGTFWKIH
jgi:hypothetical protein